MELGNIKQVSIVEQMTGAYLDYSMSVIVSRALPDVRDGLKPVHRRVLYAMDQMGLQSTKQFRKSAGTVGEVLKSYHPHGDVAVYDSLVRMAQPWSMRYPLVLGQGNFGSQDDDPPAAMRYTEAKMAAIADELLRDIDKDTVDFIPNYANGRGRIVVRARTRLEETERGRMSIIVTELPYQVNKAELVKKIAEMTRDKKIDGISEVRDESDRQGMRVYIELKRDANPESVLNMLYTYTAMQSAFNANMLALVDQQPRTLTLKASLQ